MMRADRRAVERALPQRLRGVRGYQRLLDSLTLRISVSGIRGKSGLTRLTEQAFRERGLSVYAKETGTDPISYKNGIGHPILRDAKRGAILEETLWEVKKYWPIEAIVLENQAITPYTMKVFNERLCRPHYLLVTNVRRDHLGDLARTLPRMARAFARSAPKGCALISGERDPELRRILRRETRESGVRFLDAAPEGEYVPALESVTILDALLKDWLNEGLSSFERWQLRRSIFNRYQWRPSSLSGVRWFHGAEINDVDSTQAVLDYLWDHEPLPVTFIAYFRRDRLDRTATFVPFLRRAFEQGRAARAYVAGHRSEAVARSLSPWPVRAVRDRVEEIPALLARVERECRGEAVMTIANAVPPWPRAVAAGLDTTSHERRAPTSNANTFGSSLARYAFAQKIVGHRLRGVAA